MKMEEQNRSKLEKEILKDFLDPQAFCKAVEKDDSFAYKVSARFLDVIKLPALIFSPISLYYWGCRIADEIIKYTGVK
jgi:hypothetical protein